jgi:hypothetical protein
MFNRTINHYNIADGTEVVTDDLSSSGDATATHTESFVALPSSTGSSGSGPGTPTTPNVVSTTPSSAARRAIHMPWK